jgi:hypothetical protein
VIVTESSRRRLVRLAGATQGEGLPVYFGPVEWTPALVAAYHRLASLHHLRTLLAMPALVINAREPVATGDTRFPND